VSVITVDAAGSQA